ncbi:50S ribosomal protein L5 [Candidatus Parcubacteria bacterium]|nr:MAG: 50S ribosomal protein L5 [Candidatus Parcubacteria bacterium]
MKHLLKKYREEVLPKLKGEFGVSSVMALPRIVKVIVNTGVGRVVKDEKLLEQIQQDMSLIVGQKTIATKAKKSIASFKTRQGMTIGYKATLRGKRMYDFLDRLISIALPRTRDFRGIDEKSIDKSGNLTLGVKEHIVFPEVSTEHVRNIFGLEITVVTDAKNRQEALALYKSLGFPLKK